MDLSERVNQIFGRHHLSAMDKVRELGLEGPDADKVFMESDISALKDIVTEVVAEIKELGPAL